MKRPNLRPRALLVGFLAASMLVAGACSSGGPAQSGTTNGLEVLSWWTSASEKPAFEHLIDSYQERHPGVDVTDSTVAGGAGSNAQVVLASRLASGNPPDVWQTLSGGNIDAWVRTGAVADVSSVYTDDVKDALPDSVLTAMTVKGHQYGVPTSAHRANVLMYNADVLAKAGVQAPGEDYTLTQFLADVATVKGSGATALCLGAKDSFTTATLFESLLLAHVGQAGWTAIGKDRFDWNGAEVHAALSDFSTLLDASATDSSSQTWDEAATSLAAGACAFEAMNDSAYAELRATAPEDAGNVHALAFPSTQDVYLSVIDTFVQSGSSHNATNATDFLSVLLDPAVQTEFSARKGSIPVRLDADVSGLDEYQKHSVADFRKLPILQSIAYGELVSPAFQQGFSDAVNTYVTGRDAATFARVLAERVAEGQALPGR